MKMNPWATLQFFIVVTLVLIGVMMLTTLTGCNFAGYSNGERVGYVTKFTKRGILVKTWEGDLKVYTPQSMTSDDHFGFSVLDERVVNKINVAMKKGSRLVLKYDQRFGILAPWQQDSHYTVIDCETAEQ